MNPLFPPGILNQQFHYRELYAAAKYKTNIKFVIANININWRFQNAWVRSRITLGNTTKPAMCFMQQYARCERQKRKGLLAWFYTPLSLPPSLSFSLFPISLSFLFSLPLLPFSLFSLSLSLSHSVPLNLILFCLSLLTSCFPSLPLSFSLSSLSLLPSLLSSLLHLYSIVGIDVLIGLCHISNH